jgi:hypothetical protein
MTNNDLDSMGKEIWWKVKNRTLVQAQRLCTGRTAHRGSSGIALPYLDHGTRRGWGVSVTPLPLFTPRKDLVPILQEVGWAQGRSGQMRKISLTLGFEHWTVQPVASLYTDCATRLTDGRWNSVINLLVQTDRKRKQMLENGFLRLYMHCFA